VRALLTDRDGAFWLGTYNGLVRFDPQAETFTQYRSDPANPNSLSHDFVWSLYQDSSGRLWVGTHGGLYRLDWPCGEPLACEPFFAAFTTENGLPDDSIVAIQGDAQGRLWLATMGGGLAVFDPASGVVRAYAESDGLQGRAFVIGASSRAPDGELFFGGLNGFNAFYPERLSGNAVPPPVVLTAFRVFDQPRPLPGGLQNVDEIHLSSREDFFAFEFAALDFTDPARNQYAYRLEGFDPDWVYCGTRRYAGYTNLPPGRYVFRVKASNNDGVWNETGVSVRLVIEPAFWQTLWFRLLVGLAAAGLVSLYVGGRVRAVAALRRSEERFRTLFENAPLGVCEADFSQTPPRLLHLNPRWQALFACTAETTVSLDAFLPAETLEICRLRLASGETVTLETNGRRCDGSQFPLRLSAASIARRDLRRCILAVEDVSAEKARRSEEEAIAEERRRIAREIHDGLAQDLAALRFQVRRWQALIDRDPAQAKRNWTTCIVSWAKKSAKCAVPSLPCVPWRWTSRDSGQRWSAF
jgi:PAS domain S-box-containing protein